MNVNDIELGLDFTADELVDIIELLIREDVRNQLTPDGEYKLQEILEYLA